MNLSVELDTNVDVPQPEVDVTIEYPEFDVDIEVPEIEVNVEEPQIQAEFNNEVEAEVEIDLAVDNNNFAAEDHIDEANVEIEVVIGSNENQDESIDNQVAQVEIELEIPDIVIGAEIEGNQENSKAKNKFNEIKLKSGAALLKLRENSKAKMDNLKKEMSGNFKRDVDIGADLESKEDADCAFCCRETAKACKNCFDLSLAWILIVVLSFISFVLIMKGIILCIASTGAIPLNQITAINPSNTLPIMWQALVFNIIIPVQIIGACAVWCISLMKKKSREGYGTGIKAVFAVPKQYQFTDLDEQDNNMSVEVRVDVN